MGYENVSLRRWSWALAARSCRTFRREREFGAQVVAPLARQWEQLPRSRVEAAFVRWKGSRPRSWF
jgi:hypothetical protein